MTPNEITNDFLKRFKELGEYIKTTDAEIEYFNTNDPIKEESIEKLEKRLEVKLDETLLAYFRESNGYELRYVFPSENIVGDIMIPPLEGVFLEEMEVYSNPGDYHLKMLGGRDDYEIRSKMYWFDQYGMTDDEPRPYYSLYYLLSDNVLIPTDDYEASISGDHPITVPSYFELCLATAGLTSRRKMLCQGFDGDYDVVDLTKNDYEKLYPWSKTIELAKKGLVSKAFYDLTNSVTNGEGYEFRFMKMSEDES